MRNTSFTITVPHIYSPIAAYSAESKSYIITSRFIVHGTFQINQFNSQVFDNAFIQFLWITIKC